MLSTISMFPQVKHMCNRIEVVQSWYRRPGYKLKYICITITCRLHALASNNTGQHHAPPSMHSKVSGHELFPGCSSRRYTAPLQSSRASRDTEQQQPGASGTQEGCWKGLLLMTTQSLTFSVKTFLAGCLAAPLSSSGSTHCQDPPGSSCTLSSWSRWDISATIKHN